jgi:hypothetical protein
MTGYGLRRCAESLLTHIFDGLSLVELSRLRRQKAELAGEGLYLIVICSCLYPSYLLVYRCISVRLSDYDIILFIFSYQRSSFRLVQLSRAHSDRVRPLSSESEI